MSAEHGVGARQAMIGGRFSRFVFRAVAVLCWLLVLALPVLWLVGAVDWSLAWWQAVLYFLGAVVIVVPIGFIAWFSAGEEKEDTERLRRAGRPAIAEIVAMELVDPQDGSPDVAVLGLRIVGDGVPYFEATYRTDKDPAFRVGAQFHAVVDPADNLFTLQVL